MSRGFLRGTISFRVASALIVNKLRVRGLAGREEIMTVPMLLALTARSSDTDLSHVSDVSVDLFTNFRTTQTMADCVPTLSLNRLKYDYSKGIVSLNRKNV